MVIKALRVAPRRAVMLAGVVAALAGLTTTAAAADPAYVVTLLGTDYSPGLNTVAGINKWGQVVGGGSGYSGGSPAHALLWTPAQLNGTVGSLHDLQLDAGFPVGSAASRATALNDRGEVVGGAYTPAGGDGNHAQSWLWRPAPLNSNTGVLNGVSGAATTFDLYNAPGLGTLSENPQGINNLGQIVGYGIYYHLLVWTPAVRNGVTGSWAFEPTYSSVPAGVNDAGQIAGGSSQATFSYPYLHKGLPPLVTTDFADSPLWDHTPFESIGGATGLNALGHLAVTAVNASPRQIRAFIFKNGKATDISAGGAMMRSAGINRSDEVVGQGANGRAFLYSAGATIDLNTVIPAAPPTSAWVMSRAIEVNDVGQIICSGAYLFPGGVSAVNGTFLLTPASRDVSSQFSVTIGPATGSGAVYTQTVTLTNTGAAVAGPVALALDGLAVGVKLTGASGVTHYAGPVGSQYVDFTTGAVQPGSIWPLTLTYSNPALKPIAFKARVLAGPAPR